MKKTEGTHVRLWDPEMKMYVVGELPAVHHDLEMELSTGCFDRNGKEIFWNDNVAVFFRETDNFIGLYTVNSRFFFAFPPVHPMSDVFCCALLGNHMTHYFFEVCGNVHFPATPEQIRKYQKASLKYE